MKQVRRDLHPVLYFFIALTCSAQTYTISGTVVIDKNPVKNALVTIASVAKESLKYSCITHEDGRFEFKNLPAAKFALSAERQNAAPQFFHQAEGGYSTAIATGPGLNSENLLFPLTLAGSISGTVDDEEGDPVAGAYVMLFHRGVFSGRLQTVLEKGDPTDSSGAFHYGQLTPGAYLIAAQARPWYAQDSPLEAQNSAASNLDVAYPLTYSGGSTDPNAASFITVTEGGSTTVEITLRPVPAAHVQLLRPESENANTTVGIFAIGPGGITIRANVNLMMDAGKRPMFTGVPPGHYLIDIPGGPKKFVDISGDTAVDMPPSGACSISGHVSFDGPPPASAVLVLATDNNENLDPAIKQDGAFGASGVPCGHYRVQLANAPSYDIKSLEIGGHPAPAPEVELTAGSNMELSIVAAEAVAKIDGTASRDGRPFAGAMVLLVPGDLTKTYLIRRDQSDSDGTFTLPTVLPGRYTLLAIDDGRDLAYADPTVIKPYLSFGQMIDIPRSASSPLTVNVAARQH